MNPDQRLRALSRANAARLANAELRAWIRAGGRHDGALRAAEAIQAGEHGIQLESLLQAIPGVGSEFSRAMLRRARVSGMARVNDWYVTDRQRGQLIADLMDRAGRRA